VRRLLSRIVLALLACQSVAALSAPLALCCRIGAAEAGGAVCCAGMEPGDPCPMHSSGDSAPHTSAPPNGAASAPDCRLSARCSPPDSVLLSLTCFTGVMGDADVVSIVQRVAPLPDVLQPYATGPFAPPPAPPPRS
jgi:hypothetical protein